MHTHARVVVISQPDWHYWKRAYTYWTVIIRIIAYVFVLSSVFFFIFHCFLDATIPLDNNRQNSFLSTLLRYLFSNKRKDKVIIRFALKNSNLFCFLQ